VERGGSWIRELIRFQKKRISSFSFARMRPIPDGRAIKEVRTRGEEKELKKKFITSSGLLWGEK